MAISVMPGVGRLPCGLRLPGMSGISGVFFVRGMVTVARSHAGFVPRCHHNVRPATVLTIAGLVGAGPVAC